jgi:hypothetical protein
MTSDAVWALVLGAALTLIATLVAQWSSLIYQTRRQQEARRADFQRTTLLELRTVLGEVQEIVSRAMATRRRLSDEFERSGQDPDEWAAVLGASHPDIDALRSLAHRLGLVGAGVDHEPLRVEIDILSELAFAAPLKASDREARDAWHLASDTERKAVKLLGEQLRRLP